MRPEATPSTISSTDIPLSEARRCNSVSTIFAPRPPSFLRAKSATPTAMRFKGSVAAYAPPPRMAPAGAPIKPPIALSSRVSPLPTPVKAPWAVPIAAAPSMLFGAAIPATFAMVGNFEAILAAVPTPAAPPVNSEPIRAGRAAPPISTPSASIGRSDWYSATASRTSLTSSEYSRPPRDRMPASISSAKPNVKPWANVLPRWVGTSATSAAYFEKSAIIQTLQSP